MAEIADMTMKELQERLHVLNESSIAIRNEEWQLHNRERELVKQYLQQYVGKCYSFRGKYYCIVGTPKEEYAKTATIFNEWQLPAICIDLEGEAPEDTVFADTFFRGHIPTETNNTPFAREKADEISKEQFLLIFVQAYHKYEELIMNLA